MNIKESDIEELARALNRNNAEKVLGKIRNRRSVGFSIKDCAIFERRWLSYRDTPQRNLILLGKVFPQIKLLKTLCQNSKREFHQFMHYEADRCAAIKIVFTRIEKLIALVDPWPESLKDPQIRDLGSLGVKNAHEIKEIFPMGGEGEAISAEKIHDRLIKGSTYISRLEATIRSALKEERHRLKSLLT